MKDRLLNLLTVVLTACALVVTGLVVRREFASADVSAENRTRVVSDWREYTRAGHRMGPADAPVTIVEFSDFECRYCRVLAGRLKELREKYPTEVAVLYRHYPIEGHARAVPAVRASECAAAQGRFEAYHDALFAGQDSLESLSWSRLAAQVQVPDTAAFDRCQRDTGRLTVLGADSLAARRLAVKGTPTLLINDVRLVGAVPLDTLEAYVERALQRRGGQRIRVAAPATR